ncbi:MAG: dicarboxylate/amino acid:cation symporter [Actinomycetaceae bacterium]|nr:dicarboxylate/amino acid:cation symporter [Actinomycetaceae bacterium]
MKKLSLTQKIIAGALLGVVVGYFMGEHVTYIKFIGDIFLRLVKMVVPLLVFGAIVQAVASLNLKELGKIGIKTVVIFFGTTCIAALTALAAITIFKPTLTLTGIETKDFQGQLPEGEFIDLLVNFIPANITQAFANDTLIQIIIFGLMFGIALNKTSGNSLSTMMSKFIDGLRHIMMTIVTMFMAIAPYGIFSLVAVTVGEKGEEVLLPIIRYVLTVTGANVVFFMAYTLVVAAICRLNPIKLLQNVVRTIVVGVGTGSSAMSLPTELMDAQERIGLSPKIYNFVLPLGNAINTNGAAVTTTIAGITCAYAFGIDLSFENYVMIAIYSALATFGNTTVPGGGIVAVAVVFQMAGLPLEGVAIFAGVDYFTGLTRIILNVVGDIYTAIIVAVTEKELDREVFNAKNVAIKQPANKKTLQEDNSTAASQEAAEIKAPHN